MIVQFSIFPMDSTHISGDVLAATKILSDLGLTYEVGPTGTCVQGEWREVFDAIEKCHHVTMGRHRRVVTNITIDDHRGAEHSLRGMVDAVADSNVFPRPSGNQQDMPRMNAIAPKFAL